MSARAPAGADRFVPTAVTVVLVVAMLAAAMVPWWPIYESPAFFLAAGAAIVIGSAIGVVGTRRRWPAWAVVVAVVAAYLVVGVPVAVPDQALFGVLPTPAGMVELVAGAALSWKQLVTIAVPVGSYQALLVPPFLLGLVCATLAVTIALRSRYPATAALPPALLFIAGIALGVVHVGIALAGGPDLPRRGRRLARAGRDREAPCDHPRATRRGGRRRRAARARGIRAHRHLPHRGDRRLDRHAAGRIAASSAPSCSLRSSRTSTTARSPDSARRSARRSPTR